MKNSSKSTPKLTAKQMTFAEAGMALVKEIEAEFEKQNPGFIKLPAEERTKYILEAVRKADKEIEEERIKKNCSTAPPRRHPLVIKQLLKAHERATPTARVEIAQMLREFLAIAYPVKIYLAPRKLTKPRFELN